MLSYKKWKILYQTSTADMAILGKAVFPEAMCTPDTLYTVSR